MSTRRFEVGQKVRVKAMYPPGHLRTPHYCRGKTGEVERVCGEFRNPEKLAYGDRDAEKLMLYRVHFRSADLWPDYDGGDGDSVELELYEHWIEPA